MRLGMMRLAAAAFAVGAAVALSGCFGSNEGADRDNLTRMEANVLDLIDSTCADSLQCRSIAFGYKSCGGPRSYLIYSVTHTDTVALRSAVADYNAAEEAFDHKYGYGSTCDFVSPPALTCLGGHCTRKSASPAAAPVASPQSAASLRSGSPPPAAASHTP